MPYMNEFDTLVWANGNHLIPLGPMASSDIAVLFDNESGVLLKHGLTDKVRAEYDGMRQKYIAAGHDHMVAALTIVTMPATDETIALVNDTTACAGSVLQIVERLKALDITPPARIPD